jgi:hypothetical protein
LFLAKAQRRKGLSSAKSITCQFSKSHSKVSEPGDIKIDIKIS